MEIYESKPPGTLWATPGLLPDGECVALFTASWFLACTLTEVASSL